MGYWRHVWREHLAPLLSSRGLAALARSLETDADERGPTWLQGATTDPLPTLSEVNSPARAACPIGTCGLGEGLVTVGEVEAFFARVCFGVDESLGEPAGCRWFLNWVEDSPREEVRRELLAEVRRELDRRQSTPPAS